MESCLFRVQYADGRVEELAFGNGTVRIGRASGDLILNDPNSSGVHGELRISGGSVTYTDLGSSNGSFDADDRRLSGPTRLLPGQSVRLGMTAITLLRAPSTASAPPAAARTAPMPRVSAAASPAAAAAAAPFLEALSPAPRINGGGAGRYSHPDRDVRHSYPLSVGTAGMLDAFQLLMKTAPFLVVRLGILGALTVATIIFWVLLVGGFYVLAKATPLLGWAWVVGLCFVAGSIWRFAVRYLLYLIKAAHIAVLTELITTGTIANGNEGMFHYGKRIVTERFGEVNVMFGLDMLIDGIVGAFNRTLNWIANLLPIPGLDSLMGVVNAVLRASTTYIDETIFSYNLARADENAFRSSRDGLIYYAQNAKEILKTGLWVVVADKVLSFVIWVVMCVPAYVLAGLMPGYASWGTLVFAILFAANVRSAVLRPLFLTMVMVKFHAVVKNQSIDLTWDERLTSASNKFGELTQKAETWVRPTGAPRPAPSAQPA